MDKYLTKEQKVQMYHCKTYNEMLDIEYGPIGSPERDKLESEAEVFCLAERLRQERLEAGLTQQQLADRIGAKKSYISRIENGKTDIQLTTLFRLFRGLGKSVKFTIMMN